MSKIIVNIATGEAEDSLSKAEIKSAAAALGRLRDLKGGKVGAENLSAKEGLK